MTLVVARTSPLGLLILSDIRVSHPEERRNGLPYGVLKAVILNRNLCVCFAGRVDVGATAIGELAQDAINLTAEAALAQLLAVHQRDVTACEFLLARGDPRTIWKIADGELNADLPSAWIGDHAAFARFQELSLGPPLSFQPPAHLDPDGRFREVRQITQLVDAFRLVLADETLESVGDARIPVKGDDDGFRYLPYMEIDNGLDPPAITVGPGEEVNLLRAGTAAIGAYAYSMLVPVEPGMGLVAVHILQASVGFVYFPAHSVEAAVFREVTHDEFVEQVQTAYGIKVSGIGFQAVPPN